MDVLTRVPVREQEPAVRAANFEEVCLGYNEEEAMAEAARCLNCKNAHCVQGCPVSINIPGFVEKVKEGDFAAAYQVISESSALPAVCGRVCPQESQCEGKCIYCFIGIIAKTYFFEITCAFFCILLSDRDFFHHISHYSSPPH